MARAFHDWDNNHGLELDGGGVLYGDGHLEEGRTKQLALAAARAGQDDIEVAFALGASGNSSGGDALYAKVRARTAARDLFLAEERVPRPSPENRRQNWRASDVETLWESPMVGARGTTVGEALIALLEPGEQFIRQVEALGQGLAGGRGVFAVPVLGAWLTTKCCQAYHGEFVEPLADDPKQALLSLVDSDGARWHWDTAPDESEGSVVP